MRNPIAVVLLCMILLTHLLPVAPMMDYASRTPVFSHSTPPRACCCLPGRCQMEHCDGNRQSHLPPGSKPVKAACLLSACGQSAEMMRSHPKGLAMLPTYLILMPVCGVPTIHTPHRSLRLCSRSVYPAEQPPREG